MTPSDHDKPPSRKSPKLFPGPLLRLSKAGSTGKCVPQKNNARISPNSPIFGYRGAGLPGLVCLCILAVCLEAGAQKLAPPAGWPVYGGDAGGQRYSSAADITPSNVAGLHIVWQYGTGALKTDSLNRNEAAFEATPILQGRSLFLSTPFDQVLSVDAGTGAERWRFDPHLDRSLHAGVYTSRGVAFWRTADPRGNCTSRLFLATLDARLIALDAETGLPCAGFGARGTVDLRAGVRTQTTHAFEEYGATSPPVVAGDVVVVGSAVADGQEVDVEPGVVRGFDARTGKLLWTWDPMPWAAHQAVPTGGGNTWGVLSVDPEHGLVYLPTGSPSPDFYGGMRPGDDRDADSLVALHAQTGKKAWAFQVVHHDLWDYDIAAQPLLFDYGDHIPAVAITTKMGMVFVLNRVTGTPIYPVEERPVPKSDVPGEVASPTQPFSSLPPLAPLSLRAGEVAGHTLADASACAAEIAALRNEGIYTPPSLQGSLLYPGSLGGVNWGSPAFDPETGVMYVNSNHHAFRTRLVPRWRFQLSNILGSWGNWIYAAGSLLALLLLLRRLWQPGCFGGLGWTGVIGGVGVLALASSGLFVALRPGEKQHFGRETAPQRKAPFAVERAPPRRRTRPSMHAHALGQDDRPEPPNRCKGVGKAARHHGEGCGNGITEPGRPHRHRRWSGLRRSGARAGAARLQQDRRKAFMDRQSARTGPIDTHDLHA